MQGAADWSFQIFACNDVPPLCFYASGSLAQAYGPLTVNFDCLPNIMPGILSYPPIRNLKMRCYPVLNPGFQFLGYLMVFMFIYRIYNFY